jgi:hypothetical protein
VRKQLLFPSALLGVAFFAGASRAQAQIVNDIVADIPFAFHAGSSRFPPGKYTVRVPVDYSTRMMEIVSADGRYAAFFPVIDTMTTTVPDKPELVFRKYGNDYVLWKVFDMGNSTGVELPPTEDEKALTKGRTPEERRVPGTRQQK